LPASSVSTSAFGPQRRGSLGGLRAADDDRRLRIAEEIRKLALLVARIERQVDEPRAQAREVERERFPALVDLRGDAIAGPGARSRQRVRDSGGRRIQIIVMNDRLLGDQQARLLGAFGEVRGEQRVKVGIHARSNGAAWPRPVEKRREGAASTQVTASRRLARQGL
jgi:hypothetical protein